MADPQTLFESLVELFAHWLFDETTFRLWDGKDVSEAERDEWREYVRGVLNATPGARDSKAVCGECGHPKGTHYGENVPLGRGPCHATVYENVSQGVTARSCGCAHWKPKW